MHNMILKFAAAACVTLLCAPACGVNEVAQGEAAQQRVTLEKPSAPKPTLPDPKVDVSEKETTEQRLRRLENEATRDKCLEELKAALRAAEAEYSESACTLKFKRSADDYVFANLNYADAIVNEKGLRFTCRNPNQQGNCVSTGNPAHTSSVGWQLVLDADGAELQRCLDFLHERCKAM